MVSKRNLLSMICDLNMAVEDLRCYNDDLEDKIDRLEKTLNKKLSNNGVPVKTDTKIKRGPGRPKKQ